MSKSPKEIGSGIPPQTEEKQHEITQTTTAPLTPDQQVETIDRGAPYTFAVTTLTQVLSNPETSTNGTWGPIKIDGEVVGCPPKMTYHSPPYDVSKCPF